MGWVAGKTTATNSKGETVVWNGSDWERAPRAPGSPIAGGGGRYDQDTQKTLALARKEAQAALETKRIYSNAQAAVTRLKPGPFRGAILDAALPQEGGGFWDKLGAGTIGAAMKVTGALPQRDIEDYQTIKRLQQERVATRQNAATGVQTEGDAARHMLADISVGKTAQSNQDVITQGSQLADIGAARDNFYTNWAGRYGAIGKPNEHGESVENEFQKWAQQNILAKPGGGGSGWSVKRIK